MNEHAPLFLPFILWFLVLLSFFWKGGEAAAVDAYIMWGAGDGESESGGFVWCF